MDPITTALLSAAAQALVGGAVQAAKGQTTTTAPGQPAVPSTMDFSQLVAAQQQPQQKPGLALRPNFQRPY